MNAGPLDDGNSADADAQWQIISRLIIAVTAGVLGAAILQVEPRLSANDRSRWLTVWSLVERGTYTIDEAMQRPGWDTIDKVRHDDHFYSSKPPLLATMVAGVYRGVKAVTGWQLHDDRPGGSAKVTHVILLIVNGIPMVCTLFVVANLAKRYGSHLTARLLLLLTAALGTYLSPYLVTLNNHTVAIMSVIFALSALMRVVSQAEPRSWDFAQTGFFAALACANELPAALFGIVTFVLLFRADRKRVWTWYAPAAAIPLAAFFLTNFLATGGIKPFYAYYGTEKYEYIHQGVPSYWMFPQGIDANQESPGVYLLHCTFGHHGIFSLTPIFLLTLVGWTLPRTKQREPLFLMQCLGLLLTVVILVFYLTRTANYNYGGNTAGLRWTFWLIPFWLLGILAVANVWGNRRWFRATAAFLLCASALSVGQSYENPWQPSWLYRLMNHWDWVDYRTPAPEFPRPLWGRLASLPPLESQPANWIEFSAARKTGLRDKLRIADAGRIQFDGRNARQLDITWDAGWPTQRSQRLTVLEDVIAQGGRIEAALVWPDGPPDRTTRYLAETFLRNMPKSRKYNADAIRYVFTEVSETAFRCQKAASQVTAVYRQGGPLWRYRSEFWLCDRVPFGVLRIDSIVYDETDEPLHYHRYDMTAAGWIREETDEQLRRGGSELR